MMKRNLFVFLVMALLVLSFGSAYAGPAPEFGFNKIGWIKLGDAYGNNWRGDYHGLLVDSATGTVYSIRVYDAVSEKHVIVDRSNDSGVTWLPGRSIARGEINTMGALITMDPVSRQLHYAWNTYELLSVPDRNLYYVNESGIEPIRVNGTIPVRGAYSGIAVDESGVIHIAFVGFDGSNTVYYTSSSDNGSTFSEPAPIPGALGTQIAIRADTNGIYLLYLNGRKFIYKTAGGEWSNPVDTTCTTGNDPSMVLYDSNTIYFSASGSIGVGRYTYPNWTWTCYTNTPNPGGASSLAVSSDGLLNYAWKELDGIHFVRTTGSFVPPAEPAWGTPVLAIPATTAGMGYPNVAVDSNGKAYIRTEISYGAEGYVTVFTKEK